MRHTMKLGKVDYNGCGRKINEVELEWELRSGRFTMSGGVWNGRHTDYQCCGQICEEIGKMFPRNKKVQRMVEVWREWHLNDMKAGSPAQEAELSKHTFPGYPASHFDWAKSVLTGAGLQPDAGYLHEGKPYSYGSAWLAVGIPTDVVAEIESWELGGDEVKFTLEIELGHEGMNRAWDVAKALSQVAERIRNYNEGEIEPQSGQVADINGNTVGKWEVRG